MRSRVFRVRFQNQPLGDKLFKRARNFPGLVYDLAVQQPPLRDPFQGVLSQRMLGEIGQNLIRGVRFDKLANDRLHLFLSSSINLIARDVPVVGFPSSRTTGHRSCPVKSGDRALKKNFAQAEWA